MRLLRAGRVSILVTASCIAAAAFPGVAAADKLESSFVRLDRAIPGPIWLSYGRVESNVGTMYGSFRPEIAWSTAKVPVAVAAYRANDGQVTRDIRAAITASDNDAAEAMWRSLGSPAAAGERVNEVFADAGDTTEIETRRVRKGFTAFGQTKWSIDRQQLFAARLPCIEGGPAILSLMRRIVPDQRWGLGTIGPSPRFKGGWGPDRNGNYLVRQFGIVKLKGGELAVAIASKPADGTLASGIANLNRIARWIKLHLRGETRANSC